MPWIELAAVLEDYASAYGGTWVEAFDYLETDPVESLTVSTLRGQLRQAGRFDEPILLRDGLVLNGMHRICAAALEGYKQIEYTEEDVEPEVGEWVEVHFRARNLTEDTFHTLTGVLRSFTMDGQWIECVGAGSIDGRMEFVFTCAPGKFEKLRTELEALAAGCGHPIDIEGFIPWPEED